MLNSVDDQKDSKINFRQNVLCRRLIDALEDPISILTPEGVITDLNRATEQVFQVSRNLLIGRDITKFFTDPIKAKAGLELVLKNGSVNDYRLTVNHSSGRRIDVSYSASVLLDKFNNVEAIVTSARDITEQLRREQDSRWLAAVVEGTTSAIISTNLEGVVTTWNKGAEALYGYRADEAIGKSVALLLEPNTDLSPLYDKVAHGESCDNVESTRRCKDGRIVTVLLHLSPVRDECGKICALSGVTRDVTAERAMAAALLQERNALSLANGDLSRKAEQMELLTELAEFLPVCSSNEEAYEIICQFASRLFQSSHGALYIKNEQSRWFQNVGVWRCEKTPEEGFFEEDCWAIRRLQAHVSSEHSEFPPCRHTLERAGSFLCVPLIVLADLIGVLCVCWDNPDIQPQDQTLSTRMVSDAALAIANLRLRKQLKEQSIHDPLTSLYNRRYLEEFLNQEISRSRRKSRRVSLIMFDIDHFKQFNDSFGHEAGDAVLQELARFFKGAFRESDVVTRFGGEEFLVVVPETTTEDAVTRADLIRQEVKKLRIVSGQNDLPEINLSAGVSCFPDHGNSIESLIRAADLALYKAKDEGRDRVCSA